MESDKDYKTYNRGDSRAGGDGLSYSEQESLVKSGHDGLLYKLCGCLPCCKDDNDETFTDNYSTQSSFNNMGDGSSRHPSFQDNLASHRASNVALQRMFTQDDPEPTAGEKLGRIQFSIGYDFQQSTLTLKVIRAVDLAAKDAGGTSDPYVKVILLPDKNSKLCTKRKRKNLNPKWNEVFAFEGYPYSKVTTSTLLMQVLDWDRFSKDDPIGEICIPMSDFDLMGGQTLWKNLQPSKGATGKLGQLYITLSYDSSASEIKVIIVKAMHLKAKDLNGMSDPYVKIWLMQDGRKVEKKKTTIKNRNLNPIFNETLLFTVPLERIRATALEISVMDFDRCGRNEPIGQVVLGSKSGPTEVKHWTEMFSKTKHEVGQWHVLKNLS